MISLSINLKLKTNGFSGSKVNLTISQDIKASLLNLQSLL